MTNQVYENTPNGIEPRDEPVDPLTELLQEQVATLTWLLAEQVTILAWLHAELAWRQVRVATMVASMMADKIAPQIQKTLLAQLTGSG